MALTVIVIAEDWCRNLVFRVAFCSLALPVHLSTVVAFCSLALPVLFGTVCLIAFCRFPTCGQFWV